jgi:hypothetical protein
MKSFKIFENLRSEYYKKLIFQIIDKDSIDYILYDIEDFLGDIEPFKLVLKGKYKIERNVFFTEQIYEGRENDEKLRLFVNKKLKNIKDSLDYRLETELKKVKLINIINNLDSFKRIERQNNNFEISYKISSKFYSTGYNKNMKDLINIVQNGFREAVQKYKSETEIEKWVQNQDVCLEIKIDGEVSETEVKDLLKSSTKLEVPTEIIKDFEEFIKVSDHIGLHDQEEIKKIINKTYKISKN